ncbi:hypothetical protein BH23BAC3_BH23BAC3_22440 [soil metagenome]
MNKLKGYFLLGMIIVFVIALSTSVFAQQQNSHAIKQVDIAFGSPESAAMVKYGNLDVSLYKGVPDITIPIHEFNLPNFSLPVFLSYNASGIKVDQIATSVGLGWSLHAGGQINQIVNGHNDITNPPIDSLVLNSSQLQNFAPNVWDGYNSNGYDDNQYARQIVNQSRDTKPDAYFYNYAGYSGKIISEGSPGTGNFYSVPYRNHTISYDGEFEITDEHGNRYIFDQTEGASTYRSGGTNCHAGPISSTLPGTASTKTWHLGKIITANHDTLKFHYTQIGFIYDEGVFQQKFRPAPGSGCLDQMTDSDCIISKTISQLQIDKT